MKKINIFLASSAELESDKLMFDVFIGNRNKLYTDRNIFLELRTWKDFISAMSGTRLQDNYNDYIRRCDIVVFLFHTRMGQYTLEEFEVAHEQFMRSRGRGDKGKRPLIYVYFRKSDENLPELEAFRQKNIALGHFYDTYTGDEDLAVKFGRQLDMLEQEGVIEGERIRDVSRKLKYAVYFILLPLLVLFLGVFTVRYFLPLNLTVRATETVGIPGMPYESGEATLSYADKSETLKISDEAVFRQIASRYKGDKARLVFKSDGFVTVDTTFRLSGKLDIPVRRDNSLGVIFGTVKDEDNKPLAGVSISVQDIRVETDDLGRFRVEIPLAKQAAEQRLSAYKEGYRLWDFTAPPSQTAEWKIILKK